MLPVNVLFTSMPATVESTVKEYWTGPEMFTVEQSDAQVGTTCGVRVSDDPSAETVDTRREESVEMQLLK